MCLQWARVMQILYPTHRAVSGGTEHDKDYAYDVWLVFEMPAKEQPLAVNTPVVYLPNDINDTVNPVPYTS